MRASRRGSGPAMGCQVTQRDAQRRKFTLLQGQYLAFIRAYTLWSEICKSRPCVIVSPDEMNRYVRTVVVAPLTTAGRPYPSRVPIHFAGKDGQVVVDQLRTVDKVRLARRLGALEAREAAAILEVLREFFAP